MRLLRDVALVVNMLQVMYSKLEQKLAELDRATPGAEILPSASGRRASQTSRMPDHTRLLT
jgi:hypothetical protein